MKKFCCIILAILITLSSFSIVCAEESYETPRQVGEFFFKYEKVGDYRYQLLFSKDGEYYENVEVPPFSRIGGFPAYGNGRYILADVWSPEISGFESYIAQTTNPPLYVFDENFTLMDTVEFGGLLRKYTYQDGRFRLCFYYKEDPSLTKVNAHSYCTIYYETVDGINWSLISVDGIRESFDFKYQDSVEIVDKPEFLYMDDKAENPYDRPSRIGEYYFHNNTVSKDGIEFMPLTYKGNPVDFSSGGYYGGYYVGFAYNSGIYILCLYDSDMNLVSATEWEGNPGSTVRYYKGMFYLKDYIKISDEPKEWEVKCYRSKDGITWLPIKEEEYEILYNIQVLPNGSELYTLRENGQTYEYMDGIPLLREQSDLQNEDKDMWTYYRKSVMRDGFKKVYLPLDANLTTGIRTDENYMYIKIDVLDSKCYRIPLSTFESEIKVQYDGKFLAFNIPPVIEDGRTLIPIRFLFEQMGAIVSWDEATESAIIEQDGNTIVFSIDNPIAKINGIEKTMDVPARLIYDKTMVPLRFIAENLGYTVDWDETTKIAKISKK